jgi:uncharacterized membrane protein YfcA
LQVIMQALIEALLPADLSGLSAIILIVAAATTSAITAAVGIGGGVLLLGLMAVVLPPAAIIPVHGVVQLGSNAGRALMTFRYVDIRIIGWFAPGVVLGAWLGSQFLVGLPLPLIQLCIAGFILLLCWGPPIPRVATGAAGTLLAAVLTSFVSLFVGATGPLVAAFIKQQQEQPLPTVATFAAAMTLQHAPKAIVYGAAGFIFSEWLALIAAMIAAGALGTWAGLHLLKRRTDQRFALIFNLVLTLLAARLIWQALANLL